MGLLKKVEGIMLCLVILAITTTTSSNITSADNNQRATIDVTVLNIHVKEFSAPSNMGADTFFFYMIWINENLVYKKPLILYPGGSNSLDDFYNMTVENSSVQLAIGAWAIGPKSNVFYQLDLSSYSGDIETPFYNINFGAPITWRNNTYMGVYNISTQTLTGDSTSQNGSYYVINGSNDGTGIYNGAMKFNLTSFNQTIPGMDVNVGLNVTVANNITLNQSPPQVNISVPIPNVTVDVNVSAPNVSAPYVNITIPPQQINISNPVPYVAVGFNVSPPNVSAPNVNISVPVEINQSLKDLSLPPTTINITNTPNPLNLNMSPPNMSISYISNGTEKTPENKIYITTNGQIPLTMYIIITLVGIGVLVIGAIAIIVISNMKNMLTIMDASIKMKKEKT